MRPALIAPLIAAFFGLLAVIFIVLSATRGTSSGQENLAANWYYLCPGGVADLGIFAQYYLISLRCNKIQCCTKDVAMS